jgi:hypothetical protein
MMTRRRLGGLPLAVYVTALLLIPLVALGWFSVREVERNNVAARNAASVSEAVAVHAAATSAVAPVEVERSISLGFAADGESNDTNEFERRLEASRQSTDRSLDRLESELEGGSGGAAAVQAVRASRSLVSTQRTALDDGDADAASIDSAFGVLGGRVAGIIERTSSTLTATNFGSGDAPDAARQLLIASDLVMTAANELHILSSEAFEVQNISSAEMVGSEIRHADALDDAMSVNPEAVTGLQQAHRLLDQQGNDPVVGQLDYFDTVARFVTVAGSTINDSIATWSDEAQSKNRTTLSMLILVGVASLLFGFVVMRSLAPPRTHQRGHAQRHKRGVL